MKSYSNTILISIDCYTKKLFFYKINTGINDGALIKREGMAGWNDDHVAEGWPSSSATKLKNSYAVKLGGIEVRAYSINYNMMGTYKTLFRRIDVRIRCPPIEDLFGG
jgi:hypothetical protein